MSVRSGGDDVSAQQQSSESATVPESSTSLVEPAEGRLFGRFVLVRKLGAGGMGQVWSAYDPQLDRRVAIKLIRGASSANERTRLLREAHALAKLSHPNVVPVFEVGEQDGEIFVVMEQIDGPTLRAWGHEHRGDGWQRVVALLLGAGRGLAAAHGAGLVHRDFKPDNVLIGGDASSSRARVVDFGLVRVGPRDADSAPQSAAPGTTSDAGALVGTITRDDAVLGTPGYMAPEQFLGEPVDARTDQFAFCVTAIEALLGERPFRGETRLAIAAAVTTGAVTLRDATSVPRWLMRELVRGLAVDPAQRHASMDALLTAIDRDPGRTRKRLAMAGIAVLAIGGAAWSAGRTAGGDAPCSSAEPRMAALVSEQRRAAIADALVSADVGYDARVATNLVARLDTYAGGWAAAHRDACEATHVRGEQSEALLDLRMRCLARREAALVATVELLEADRGRGAALAAPRMIAELPDPTPCADPEFVADERAIDDPAIAAARTEIELTIARARAQLHAARFADGNASALEAIAAATEAGLDATRAEAMLVHGLALQDLGDASGSQTVLTDAMFLALTSGHDDAAVGSATALVYGVGHMLGDDAGGTLWARHARALVHRKGVEPVREWHVENAIGVLHLRHDRLEDAKAAFETALERMGDTPNPIRAEVLNNLGAVALRRDDTATAKRHFDAAMALDIEVFGEQHPHVADALNNLGTVAVRAGDAELAKPLVERALAIRQRALAPDHPAITGTLSNLAGISLELGHTDEAVAFLRRAIELYDARPENNPIERARARHNLAVVLHDAARSEEALVPAREALALRIAVFGERHLDTAGSRAVLGSIHLGLGDARAAVDELERALALRTELDAGAYMLANTRLVLAKALWERRPGDPRAHALAREAEAAYVAAAPAYTDELAEARDWLATHGG
jgi:tetratricopeptide (TPR) repeat protein